MRISQVFPSLHPLLSLSLEFSHDQPSATQIRHSSTGLEGGWGLCDTKFTDLSFNIAMLCSFYCDLPFLQIVLQRKMNFCINLIDHVSC